MTHADDDKYYWPSRKDREHAEQVRIMSGREAYLRSLQSIDDLVDRTRKRHPVYAALLDAVSSATLDTPAPDLPLDKVLRIYLSARDACRPDGSDYSGLAANVVYQCNEWWPEFQPFYPTDDDIWEECAHDDCIECRDVDDYRRGFSRIEKLIALGRASAALYRSAELVFNIPSRLSYPRILNEDQLDACVKYFEDTYGRAPRMRILDGDDPAIQIETIRFGRQITYIPWKKCEIVFPRGSIRIATKLVTRLDPRIQEHITAVLTTGLVVPVARIANPRYYPWWLKRCTPGVYFWWPAVCPESNHQDHEHCNPDEFEVLTTRGDITIVAGPIEDQYDGWIVLARAVKKRN